MVSSIRAHAPYLALLCAGVGAALAAVASLSEATLVDRALPVLAAIVAICTWMARGTVWATIGSLLVAMLPLSSLAAPDVTVRLFLFGTTFALALAAAIVPRLGKPLNRNEGLVLFLLLSVPFRLLGADARVGAIGLAIVAGCAALVWLRPSWNVFAIAAAAAIATPSEPWRAALFPWILASFAAPVPWMLRPIVTLPLAILGGRWAWPFVIAAGALAFFERHDEDAPKSANVVAAPFYAAPLAWAAALRGAVAFAEFFTRLDRGAVVGLALVAGGAFLRPPLAVLYGLAGAAIAVLTSKRESLAPGAAAIGFAALIFLPWSGALSGAFPLPLDLTITAAAVACAALSTFLRGRMIAGLAGGVALVGWIFYVTAGAGEEWIPAQAVLEPGKSATIALPHRGREVELSLSGGNVASLRRGTELGTIDLIDTRGSAYRRSIRVGEISDWSALSPDQYWRNQNGLPSAPRGPIEGLGAGAFLNGAGVVRAETPVEATAIRVTASPELPPTSRLHLDAVRLVR